MPARRMKFVSNNHREHRSKKGRRGNHTTVRMQKSILHRIKEKIVKRDKVEDEKLIDKLTGQGTTYE